MIERAVVLCDHTQLDVGDLPYGVVQTGGHLPQRDVTDRSLADADAAAAETDAVLASSDLSVKSATARLERRLIARALHKTRGNRAAAARLLELSHRALLYKLREYGLDE